jgi:TolA-binding protein
MTSSDPDIEPLIDALRSDFPEQKQAERLRARLVAAGIIASGVVATPSAAAGSTGSSALGGAGAQASVVSKAAAVFGGSKVLLAAVVVAGSSLPVAAYVVQSSTGTETSKVAEAFERANTERSAPSAAPAPLATPELPAPAQESVPLRAPVAEEERAADVRPAPVAPVTRPERPVTTSSPSPEPETPLPRASVAAFAPITPPPQESTLRAEAELMARALSALRSGEYTTARSLLRQHAERFPNGALAPERDRALARLNQAETTNQRDGAR